MVAESGDKTMSDLIVCRKCRRYFDNNTGKIMSDHVADVAGKDYCRSCAEEIEDEQYLWSATGIEKIRRASGVDPT